MKNKALVLAALIFSGTVMSGLADINVNHFLHLPSLDSHRITEQVTWNLVPPFKHKIVHIRLNNEVKDSNWIKDVIQVLEEADNNTTVIFHLKGYGGDVEAFMWLINCVHTTKAYVIMHVEAPVYSGHAYLALSGDKLIMDPLSSLMLHSSSAVDINCATQTGTDRGVSMVEKCNAYKNNDLYLSTKALLNLPYLTPGELQQIFTGHDVYITADAMNSRM